MFPTIFDQIENVVEFLIHFCCSMKRRPFPFVHDDSMQRGREFDFRSSLRAGRIPRRAADVQTGSKRNRE